MPNPRTMLQTTGTATIRAKYAPNVYQTRPQQSQKNGSNTTKPWPQRCPPRRSRRVSMGLPDPVDAQTGARPPTSSSEMNQTPPSAARFNPLKTMTYSRPIFPIRRPQYNHIRTVRFSPSDAPNSLVISRGSPDIWGRRQDYRQWSSIRPHLAALIKAPHGRQMEGIGNIRDSPYQPSILDRTDGPAPSTVRWSRIPTTLYTVTLNQLKGCIIASCFI